MLPYEVSLSGPARAQKKKTQCEMCCSFVFMFSQNVHNIVKQLQNKFRLIPKIWGYAAANAGKPVEKLA